MSYSDPYAYLRAAEVANSISVIGELNKAMALAKNLPESEKRKIAERAKEIAEEKGIPFDHPDL